MKIDTSNPSPSHRNRPAPARRLVCGWAILLGAFAIGGCASAPPAPRIHARADAVINRDAGGAPLSVVVRTYQLSDRKGFDRLGLDLIASGKAESELLGDQLLSQQEFVLTPGAMQEEPLALAKEARYVGIVGFFLRPDAQAWRLLLDAAEVKKQGLRFAVRDCYLVGEMPAALAIPGHNGERKPQCDAGGARAAANP